MNFTFHWFRRDLRRHAPSIVLWMLLVAVFTWARFLSRTYPHVTIPDRDLWLSIPAAALGFAEVCLILGIMLDDPVRGTNAFWKTRPPGGGAVFGAKVLTVVLVGIVIPLAAEAVFLAMAGPSGGIATRMALYLVPPGLAVVAGVAALNWKGVLIWLPVVMAAVIAAVGLTALFEYYRPGYVRYTDERLVVGAELGAAVVCGFLACRRRCRQKLMAVGCVSAPLLVATAVACSGWPTDPRLKKPSPGMQADRIAVEWRDTRLPFVDRRDSQGPTRHYLTLPLRIKRLQEGFLWRGVLSDVKVESPSGKTLSPSRRQANWMQVPPNLLESWPADWLVEVDGSEANRFLLENGKFTVSGRFVFSGYLRKRHVMEISGKQQIFTDYGTWMVTPVVIPGKKPGSRALWADWEFVEPAGRAYRGQAWLDTESAELRQKTKGLTFKLNQFSIYPWANVWEGIGRGSQHLNFSYGEGDTTERRKAWEATATDGTWELKMDSLTLDGTVEVPFELQWSK